MKPPSGQKNKPNSKPVLSAVEWANFFKGQNELKITCRKIWMSPQAFRPTKKWLDAFYSNVNLRYPWFGSVVFGPWVKTPLPEIRKIVSPKIPIRRYPDITHSISCQYPVKDWDLAFAMTLGRECYNPCPAAEKVIHSVLDEFAEGSISFSEGINDEDISSARWLKCRNRYLKENVCGNRDFSI